MTTEELLNKLSKKYPSPQFAFLTQVRNQTGYSNGAGKVRTADAMALGLWKSRGYYLHGFELKISRSDWLHEFKDPSKAEAIAEYCDYFNLVIPTLDIIDVAEVPPTWGIMYVQNGSVKTYREAQKLKSESISREFLCGFLRNVTESIEKQYTPTIEVDNIIKRRVEQELEWKVKQAVKNAGEYEKLCQKLEEFEKASGIPLKELKYQWGNENNGKKIGDAVKIVMDGGDQLENLIDRFERLMDESERLLKVAKESFKVLKEVDARKT
jgi:hypothetical protein